MEHRTGIDAKAASIMVLLCLIWGAQQVAVKHVASDISPMLQTAIRCGIAALLVGIVMVFKKETISLRDGTIKAGLLVGFLFALEFLFLSEALRLTTASHTSVFLYTAPAFAALGLHWKLPSERLHKVQWFGLFLAFAGVAYAFLGAKPHAATTSSPNMILGDFFAVLGGLAWGATTVAIRSSRLSNAPASQTLFYQLTVAFFLLLLGSFVFSQNHFELTSRALASLFFQSIIVSFISYLIWFMMLRNYLASRLGVLSFMTPFFGIALGVLLLNEPLESSFVIGALLVFAGILLVTAFGWLRQFLFKRYR
ncbi:DMT family transporter [Bdellovibrio sp. 22V]|uniref:DMT family transporter n=1 Tax=Bdellovibrio TaxID=958 RepID=UPI002543BCBF|nr:DMT family transporter [Bdellovibrio sp. 22V]WII71632.1 DMT family transporter [Bdellovibrio sp. 22V]